MDNSINNIRDWQVRIPLTPDDGREPFDVVFRVPARTRTDAVALAGPVALHVADATRTVVNIADLDPTDVDDTRSADELLHVAGQAQEEVAYWRKVVAGLAGKYPLALQLTEDEFNAADGDSLTCTPGPDRTTMVFMTAATFGAVMDQRAARERVTEPVLLPAYEMVPITHNTFSLPGMLTKEVQCGSRNWRAIQSALIRGEEGIATVRLVGRKRDLVFRLGDDVVTVRDPQPELDGGEQDPDVRRCRARNTGIFDQIQVLHEGRWYGLDTTQIRTNGSAVMFVDGHEQITVPQYQMVTVRPSSWTGNGGQLALPQVVGQQVLLDGEWRTVVGGARIADREGWVEVTTKTDSTEPVSIQVERDDEFQIRHVPTGWDQ